VLNNIHTRHLPLFSKRSCNEFVTVVSKVCNWLAAKKVYITCLPLVFSKHHAMHLLLLCPDMFATNFSKTLCNTFAALVSKICNLFATKRFSMMHLPFSPKDHAMHLLLLCARYVTCLPLKDSHEACATFFQKIMQ